MYILNSLLLSLIDVQMRIKKVILYYNFKDSMIKYTYYRVSLGGKSMLSKNGLIFMLCRSISVAQLLWIMYAVN